METLLIGLVVTLVSIWAGSIEIRMRNMDEKLRQVPTRREVSKEIEVRQESVKVLLQELKEDIKQVRHTLDKLADKK